MKRPTAVIADDAPQWRDDFRHALLALWPELHIVGEARDGIDAVRLLGARSPDILFLDTWMPRLTGLEVAAQARGRCHVVFVTTCEQHAIAAFDHGAVDFVLRPVPPARLATAVARLQERLALANGSEAGARHWLRCINASEGANVRLINVEEVCYFRAATKYTLVVTADHECLIRKPVKELVADLDPDMFWQIHRGTLVNVRAVDILHRTPAGNFELRLRTRSEALQVSAPYVHRFKQM